KLYAASQTYLRAFDAAGLEVASTATAGGCSTKSLSPTGASISSIEIFMKAEGYLNGHGFALDSVKFTRTTILPKPAITWSLTQSGPEFGNINTAGLYQAGTQLGRHQALVKATARVAGKDYSGYATVELINPNQTSGVIDGDIYARGNVGNLTVSADS